MAKTPCTKCSKEIGWISQNKIGGVIYCEDCFKEIKQEEKAIKKNETKKDDSSIIAKGRGKNPEDEKGEEQKVQTDVSEDRKNNTEFYQKLIFLFTATILLAMLLFPPFHSVYKGLEVNMKYAFIFTPPDNIVSDKGTIFKTSVNAFQLLVQYIYIVSIGALLWLMSRKTKK